MFFPGTAASEKQRIELGMYDTHVVNGLPQTEDDMRALLAVRKSSYSGTEGGDCVEAAAASNAVRVRLEARRQARPHGFPGSVGRFVVLASSAGAA